MHHSHTHTNRNNNTKHRQHNNPSQTNHQPKITDNNQPKDKNIVILQININGIRNKIEELKTSYTAPNRTSSQYKIQISHRKLKHQKIPHYTNIRTDGEHKQGGGLITLIKDDITFTNINYTQGHQHTHTPLNYS